MTWVTIEGINGAGKTHLAGKAAARLGCRLIGELTDADNQQLPGQVITALAAEGSFLRTGNPVTETLAILALKTREYERAGDVPLVLEDRGVDTVAVYQALILEGVGARLPTVLATASRIYRTALRSRPAPARSLLMVDDTAACIARYEQRIGCAISAPDRSLVQAAAALYPEWAALEPARWVIVDRRGREEETVLAELCDRIQEVAAP
jgi:dTMP kinase